MKKNKIFFVEQFMFVKQTLNCLVRNRGAIVSLHQERDSRGCVKIVTEMKLLEEEITGLVTLFQNRWKQTLIVGSEHGNLVFTIR